MPDKLKALHLMAADTHTHTNPRMKTSIDELEGNGAFIENVKDVSISIFN